jgi:hypothetical protein
MVFCTSSAFIPSATCGVKAMKKLILGLAAAAAMGAAAPAVAQDYGYGQGYGQGYNWGYGSRSGNDWYGGSRYGEFADDIAHVRQGIRHGLSDGSYDRWEAMRFSRELRGIENLVWRYNSDGRFNPWERAMIQRRLERLHEIMHEAHDEGHDRQDRGYDDDYGYRR